MGINITFIVWLNKIGQYCPTHRKHLLSPYQKHTYNYLNSVRIYPDEGFKHNWTQIQCVAGGQLFRSVSWLNCRKYHGNCQSNHVSNLEDCDPMMWVGYGLSQTSIQCRQLGARANTRIENYIPLYIFGYRYALLIKNVQFLKVGTCIS